MAYDVSRDMETTVRAHASRAARSTVASRYVVYRDFTDFFTLI